MITQDILNFKRTEKYSLGIRVLIGNYPENAMQISLFGP